MRHGNYLVGASSKQQPPGYRFATTDYDQFQIIHVMVGELVFGAGHIRKALGPGGIALLRQESVFELSCPRVGYEGVCFLASGELPAEFVGQAEPLSATVELRAVARLMERQLTSPGPEARSVLVGLGHAMAWEVIRQTTAGQEPAAGSRDWAETVRAVLEASVYSPQSVRDALAGLPLSYRQLSRYFRKAYGLSPKGYQLQLRLAEAQRLLRQTRMPITDIAMELGFCTSQHFANRFGEHVGQSPSAYRRETM